MGGGQVAREVVRLRLADEIRLHVAPVLLGAGTRRFDATAVPMPLEQVAAVRTATATHLTYRPRR